MTLDHLRTISSTEAYTGFLIIPAYTGEDGIYGFEKVAKLADTIAAIPSIKYVTEGSVVTASIEYFYLNDTFFIGDFIELKARIIATTTKSMVIDVLIYKENVREKSLKKQVGEAAFIYVAVQDGKAIPIVPLDISSEEEKEWNKKGLEIIAQNRQRRHI